MIFANPDAKLGKIIFNSTKNIFDSRGSGNPINIFMVDANGENFRQLTDTPSKGLNFGATVSPDGKTIAFISSRGGNDEIYIMNSDGTGQQCLTESRNGSYWPSISPDGKQIAFQTGGDEGWMIHLVNVDGTDLRQISRKTDSSRVHKNPVFSSDGTRIIYESRDLCIVDINTGEIESIPIQKSPHYFSYQHVAVSPDGRKIAFEGAHCRWLDEDVYEWIYAIFTSNIDGSELKKMSGDFETAREPIFSRDGEFITFVAKAKASSREHVYAMRLDDSEPLKVSHRFGKAYSPTFSPDGARIAFVGRKRGEKKGHIFSTRLDGSDVQQITDVDMGLNSLSWAPSL